MSSSGDIQMWKLKNDKFLKVLGIDVGQTEKYETTWMCHGCQCYPAEYKLTSQSHSKFGMYCRSCMYMSYTLMPYGGENEAAIKGAI